MSYPSLESSSPLYSPITPSFTVVPIVKPNPIQWEFSLPPPALEVYVDKVYGDLCVRCNHRLSGALSWWNAGNHYPSCYYWKKAHNQCACLYYTKLVKGCQCYKSNADSDTE